MGSNIGAKGLMGEAYNGHAFWDTETYCLAQHLFSDPRAARSPLMYRYKTLPQAREKTRELTFSLNLGKGVVRVHVTHCGAELSLVSGESVEVMIHGQAMAMKRLWMGCSCGVPTMA